MSEQEMILKTSIQAAVAAVVVIASIITSAAGALVAEEFWTVLGTQLGSLAGLIVSIVFIVRALRAARKRDLESKDTGTFTPPPSAAREV